MSETNTDFTRLPTPSRSCVAPGFQQRLAEIRSLAGFAHGRGRTAFARAMGKTAGTVWAWEQGGGPNSQDVIFTAMAELAETAPFASSPSPDAWAKWLLEGGERPAVTSIGHEVADGFHSRFAQVRTLAGLFNDRAGRKAFARALGLRDDSRVLYWQKPGNKPRTPYVVFGFMAKLAEAVPLFRSPSPDAWARWLVEGGDRPQGPREPDPSRPRILDARPRLERADFVRVLETVKSKPTKEAADAFIEGVLATLVPGSTRLPGLESNQDSGIATWPLKAA